MQELIRDDKENELKNILKKEAGITLIALVITIIVLLILAGVSIAMLTGNNGILNQAKLAKENTQAAKEQEEKDLDKINSYINEKTIKDNYTDINGDKATIPEGFEVDTTENVISKGLVVHGPDKANGDNGSEFVWVPVPDINSMAQCSTAGGNCNLQLEDGTLKCKIHDDNEDIVGKLYATELENNNIENSANTTYNVDNGLREPALLSVYDNDSDLNKIGLTLLAMQTDYKNMATSVAKYRGFYIGRYETSLSDATTNSAGTNGNAQSKSGVIPTSAYEKSTYAWYQLYKVQYKTYARENDSVESSMIWGSQYDAMLNWAKIGEDKEKTTNTSLGNNSGGSVAITGNSRYSEDSINNIKDLGGNLREWTLEGFNSSSRVYRGGDYSNMKSPSFRYSIYSGAAYSEYGSRMTLYIK